MKGWRHLRVDQQIPPREKNETGVYDGRHIFSPSRIRSPSRLSPGAPPPLFRKKNSPPTPAPAASFPSRRRRTAVETVGGTRPSFRSRCKILIRSVVFLEEERSGPSRRNALRASGSFSHRFHSESAPSLTVVGFIRTLRPSMRSEKSRARLATPRRAGRGRRARPSARARCSAS